MSFVGLWLSLTGLRTWVLNSRYDTNDGIGYGYALEKTHCQVNTL